MKTSGITDVAVVAFPNGSQATLNRVSNGSTEELLANGHHALVTCNGVIIDAETGLELKVIGYLGTWRPSDCTGESN